MMKHRLTEDDLEKIFIASQFKQRSPLLVFISFLGIFLLFFISLLYILNFSAVNKKIAWWYMDQFGTQPRQLIEAVSSYQSAASSNRKPFPNIPDNSIFIESINTEAPITFGVENNESTVSEKLKKGAIQLSGSSLPGEKGNTFITAHSSNFPWVSSKYNSAFALLGNVVVGDLVQIKFRNIDYIYRVNKIYVVDPSETSVIESRGNLTTLTLMTCTPVGTSLRRLIVEAEQIIPLPENNSMSTTPAKFKLPAGVR